MTRDELIARTRQLVDEGERLQGQPSMGALRLWLQLSDDLLAAAWGAMDRYHLAWLMVGKPKNVVRGRPMTPGEEAAYVREVAEQKTAALRMSLDAVERQGMPFRGEERGLAPGQGMGAVPRGEAAQPGGEAAPPGSEAGPPGGEAAEPGGEAAPPGAAPQLTLPVDGAGGPGRPRSLPLDPALAERLAEARRRAAEHEGHDVRRAPRPEKMQR
jgi:hypothetical protein